ncbi:hypothetical protein EcWSU1_01518 [Enterobacter ludwigii]|uniref:Uncharacterized protein n=1 Tax=Enterobacter ludwigii TaxID=299767 RepID=G8LHR6_9ENTR|nr:hypothetical protein EcWSU1_01518 [Enterobacter ludwigii]
MQNKIMASNCWPFVIQSIRSWRYAVCVGME